MVPVTLYGTGIIWSPHMYVWSPNMYDLMVPPYLIWNRYHMVPSHVCMVPLTVNDYLWSPIPYME